MGSTHQNRKSFFVVTYIVSLIYTLWRILFRSLGCIVHFLQHAPGSANVIQTQQPKICMLMVLCLL